MHVAPGPLGAGMSAARHLSGMSPPNPEPWPLPSDWTLSPGLHQVTSVIASLCTESNQVLQFLRQQAGYTRGQKAAFSLCPPEFELETIYNISC